MLSVLIQFQCPSLELLYPERSSSSSVPTSPLLVIYHWPLRKSNTWCNDVLFDLVSEEQGSSHGFAT